MPRNSFAVGALQGATPGLSRLAQSIGGGQGAYEGGYDRGITQQSKIAQALANINASNASADAHRSIATQNDAETGILTNRGNAIDESIAADTGTTLPMLAAVRDFIKTGNRPMKAPVGPPMEDGTEAAAMPVVDDGTQSKIAKALARSLVLRTNLKDTKPDDVAQAASIYRNSDLSDAVINGTLDRNRVGGAQAAAAGKVLYNAENNGTVLDQYGGTLDETGGLAKANITLTGAKTKAEGALATERYASAGLHRVQTENARSDGKIDENSERTAQAIASGQLPPPTGMALLNPKNQRMLGRVMEINPNYDATTVSAKRKAANDFTTGQQGNALRSFAVAGQHLEQLGGLVDALGTGNIQGLNKLATEYAQQTGSPAPTNFDAVRDVVGKEVVKAIVAGGGGVEERRELAALLDKAKSPKQLKGVISQFGGLMAAQHDALMTQRRAAGLPDSTLPDYRKAHAAGNAGVPAGSFTYLGKEE